MTPEEDDSTSPGHESSGREFRKHKQEIRKIRKELVEIRHSEVHISLHLQMQPDLLMHL